MSMRKNNYFYFAGYFLSLQRNKIGYNLGIKVIAMLKDKLLELMEEKGINKSELSKGADIPYTTIDGLFKKNSENIKLPTLKKLAAYFNCSMDYLADDESYKKSQWGNDAANREYLADKPELLEIYDQIVNRDDMVILFDKTKDLEPKDVESVLMFVQTIRKQRGLDD